MTSSGRWQEMMAMRLGADGGISGGRDSMVPENQRPVLLLLELITLRCCVYEVALLQFFITFFLPHLILLSRYLFLGPMFHEQNTSENYQSCQKNYAMTIFDYLHCILYS